MSCRQVIEFLDAYLEGSLPWYQRGIFWSHLLLCKHCRRYLASYKTTVALAREAFPEPYAATNPNVESIPEEIIAAIMRACK